MDHPTDTHQPIQGGDATATAVPIQIDHLDIRYDNGLLAVEDFSLAVQTGQFVSVVGPSGCGKTSVLNILTGLLPNPGDAVRIFGRAPHAGNPDVAYMMARDCLFPWRTVLGNAVYGMELRGVARRDARTRASELLRAVGLGAFLDAYPKALSHGMRQRCALARTFCLDSPVLLMDEPFGALDAQTKLQLEDVLLELAAQARRTVIFITHDLAEAVTLSDRILVMSRRPGRIVADVPIDLPRPRSARALQADPDYHAIYARVWQSLDAGDIRHA